MGIYVQPQEVILRRLCGAVRRACRRRDIGYDTIFADLELGAIDPTSICLNVSEDLNLPEFPPEIVNSIPTIDDCQGILPPMASGTRRWNMTLRQLSVTMTVWLSTKHPPVIQALAKTS
ncbi:MAG: hypothetical protein WC544_04375 [Patescibacteria group bacterium]